VKLKNVKIKIKNKEHCKAVLDRLYEIQDERIDVEFIDIYGSVCGVIYINDTTLGWGKYSSDDDQPDYKLLTLDDLYDLPKERERIELREYICDYGYVRFLTKELKTIVFFVNGNALSKINPNNSNKCTLAPNYRTIYAWADDLTYCKEGE